MVPSFRKRKRIKRLSPPDGIRGGVGSVGKGWKKKRVEYGGLLKGALLNTKHFKDQRWPPVVPHGRIPVDDQNAERQTGKKAAAGFKITCSRKSWRFPRG